MEQKVYFSKVPDPNKWPEIHECFVIFIPRKFWLIRHWKQCVVIKTFIGEMENKYAKASS